MPYSRRRVANAALTGWLEDHAVVVENGRIEAVVPRASLADTVVGRPVSGQGDLTDAEKARVQDACLDEDERDDQRAPWRYRRSEGRTTPHGVSYAQRTVPSSKRDRK